MILGIIFGSIGVIAIGFIIFWFLLRKKTITYELYGGENDPMNHDKVSHNSQEILLADPTRDGFKFKGWFLDKDYKKAIKAIPANLDKDLTVYAKWEKNTK